MTDIIIPTYGQESYTCACFDSILKWTSDYRLVWVDNNSKGSSRDEVMNSFLRHRDRLSVWHGLNSGFVGGVNSGLKITTGIYNKGSDFIVVANNDIVVSKGWLDQMMKVMEKNKDIAAVGPVTSAKHGQQGWKNAGVQDSFENLSVNGKSEILCEYNKGKYEEVPVVTFFCTLFRASVFEEIGLLDEDFGVGLWDDHAFCSMIREAGRKVAVCKSAYVEHYHRTTFKSVYSEKELKRISNENQKKFRKKFSKSK